METDARQFHLSRLATLAIFLAFIAVFKQREDASAHSEELPSLASEYSTSDIVASVEVIAKNIQRVNGTTCGTRYTGVIIRSFKLVGEKHALKLTFGRAEGLELGHDYLLFFQRIGDLNSEYANFERKIVLADQPVRKADAELSRAEKLAIIQCQNLIPGLIFDNRMRWPIQKGDLIASGLFPRGSIPTTIRVDDTSGPQHQLRATDVYRYLDGLKAKVNRNQH